MDPWPPSGGLGGAASGLCPSDREDHSLTCLVRRRQHPGARARALLLLCDGVAHSRRGSPGKGANNSYRPPQADDLSQCRSAAPLSRRHAAPWRKGSVLRSPGNCLTVNGSLFLQIHILLTRRSLCAQGQTGEVIMWMFPKWAYTQELSFSSVVHVIFSEQE